jgi:hypothetical protein
LSTYQKIQQEINAIVSLRYHRAVKENEALLPSLCNSDDPEGLVFENYWQAYFEGKTKHPVN